MNVSKSFTKDLESINKGLFAEWSNMLSLFVIKHKDPRTAKIRKVMLVEKEGEYMPLDNRTLHRLRESFPWKLIEQHSNADDLANEVFKMMDTKDEYKKRERINQMKDWNRDNMNWWRKAKEEFIRNLSSYQVNRIKKEQERSRYDKKIIV